MRDLKNKSNKIVKIIGKITLSEEQKFKLASLGVTDILK